MLPEAIARCRIRVKGVFCAFATAHHPIGSGAGAWTPVATAVNTLTQLSGL
jgi:hypothetical protein